jgi:hypothetical protein
LFADEAVFKNLVINQCIKEFYKFTHRYARYVLLRRVTLCYVFVTGRVTVRNASTQAAPNIERYVLLRSVTQSYFLVP